LWGWLPAGLLAGGNKGGGGRVGEGEFEERERESELINEGFFSTYYTSIQSENNRPSVHQDCYFASPLHLKSKAPYSPSFNACTITSMVEQKLG